MDSGSGKHAAYTSVLQLCSEELHCDCAAGGEMCLAGVQLFENFYIL